MSSLSTTANMGDWFNSGWVIEANHTLALVESPPPSPTAEGELLRDWSPPSGSLWEDLEFGAETYQEFIEDLFVAQQTVRRL